MPKGKESDIVVTNVIFSFVDQPGDIKETNEQAPV